MEKINFTEKLELHEQDLIDIKNRSISTEILAEQYKYLVDGIKPVSINRPCTIEDGIVKVNKDEKKKLIELFEITSSEKEIVKFVPASGAATRMFKSLIFVDNESPLLTKEVLENNKNEKEYASSNTTITNLNKFAFFDELQSAMQKAGLDLNAELASGKLKYIFKFLLYEEGLNLAKLPKGLIKFHKYKNNSRTPLEEHLVEGANYSQDKSGKSKIHFTISEEHELKIKNYLNDALKKFSTKEQSFELSFSFQKKSTDTIALDEQNKIVRDTEGKILFRPAGHGALLENLNEIDADIIFIKNIDNVVVDRLKEETFNFKKVLAGKLIEVQTKIFSLLNKIDNDVVEEVELSDLFEYMKNELNIHLPNDFNSFAKEEKLQFIHSKLNRPIRICGMVKNEGEPGGGPFWINEKVGLQTMQIVESAQVDFLNENQAKAFNSSTHFNPVDLVGSVKNYKGEKFNLLEFRNPDFGIVSSKSFNGNSIKVLELPGLWNGSMHNWITIFCEVPLITFNPVKEINDLLKDVHQQK